MMNFFTKRLRDEDRGFTLIELMVVVLIIAILIAIAIPTFLGARRRAQDRAAQSNLRNTVNAAKVIFSDREDYRCIYDGRTDGECDALGTLGPLIEGEPSLTFVDDTTDADATGTVSVLVDADDRNLFQAATWSRSGICWFVQDITGPVTADIPGTSWAAVENENGVGCDAAAAPDADDDTRWVREPGDVEVEPAPPAP